MDHRDGSRLWLVDCHDYWTGCRVQVFIIGYDFAWQCHASLTLCIHSGFTTEVGSESLGVPW